MTYIIENVNILKSGQINRTSLLIEKNRISLMRPFIKSYVFMRMEGDSFIMTAPHVILKTQIPMDQSFLHQKEYFSNQFIRKGCTTFLTYVEINYEFELESKLKSFEKSLINSPIDYVIGVKIPLRLLTASFMRQCKQRKIAAIFVVVDKKDELHEIPWGWIKEAIFPYNSPLIPIFSEENDSNEIKQTKLIWQRIMAKGNIPSFADEILEDQSISRHHLAKIGIYPLKASIHQGAEVSYNLYKKSFENNYPDESILFRQHEKKLLVTVHKGIVVRAGEQVNFQPGFGESVKIRTPSFFSIDDTQRGT